MTWYRIHFFDVTEKQQVPADLEHAQFHFSSKNDHTGLLLGKLLHYFSDQYDLSALLGLLDYADDLDYKTLNQHAQMFGAEQQQQLIMQTDTLLSAIGEMDLEDLEAICEDEISEKQLHSWLNDSAQPLDSEDIDKDADDLYSLLQVLNYFRQMLEDARQKQHYVIYRSFCQ